MKQDLVEQPGTHTMCVQGATTAPPTTTTPLSATSSDRGAILAALTDALAGAIGSVVAVAVFYPIDIAKTRAQASLSPDTCLHHHDGTANASNTSSISLTSGDGIISNSARTRSERRGWFRSRTLAALVSIVKTEGGLTRLYEGIEAKALQALLGSFVYFYAYAFIKGVMRRRAAVDASGGIGRVGASKSLMPSLNLLAAALAGAVNQAFTLPLENVTTRMQTAPQLTAPSPPSVADRSRGTGMADGGGDGSGGGLETSTFVGGRVGGGNSDSSIKRRDPGPGIVVNTLQNGESQISRVRGRRQPRQSLAAATRDLYRESGGMGRFWRGFAPSLILTSNPAINYTAFDMLKALWLRRRDAANAAANAGGIASSTERSAAAETARAEGFLNPLEAFLVAAASKSLATLITYPLIRAKVVLMTSPSSPASPIIYYHDRHPPTGRPSAAAAAGTVGLETRGGWEGGVPASWNVGRNDRNNDAATNTSTRLGRKGGGEVSSGKGDAGVAVMHLTARESSASRLPMASGSIATAAAATATTVRETTNGDRVEGDMRSMGKVLLDIFRREGLGGLYAGCGAQLLHTILKSALLLATKEQIARAAASAVYLGGKAGGATKFR